MKVLHFFAISTFLAEVIPDNRADLYIPGTFAKHTIPRLNFKNRDGTFC